MKTVVFEIPLLGTSAYHRDNLSALDRIVAEHPTRLIIKLLGPGGLAPEAILAYYDLLGTLTYATEIIAVSYSNLIGADLALFVLGSPRDIRPNAWCYVYSSPTWAFGYTRDEAGSGSVAIADHESRSSLPFDWRNYFFDYEKCLRLINEHLQLDEIVDRRLEVSDLKEHLLIDSGEIDALLFRKFTRGAKPVSETGKNPSKSRRKRPPQNGDQRNRIL
jgi:hypothetical protein